VQLATRVPLSTHKAVKLHCVRTDQSVMAFVVAALRERLARETKPATPRRTARPTVPAEPA
jgi:hypothetical protein